MLVNLSVRSNPLTPPSDLPPLPHLTHPSLIYIPSTGLFSLHLLSLHCTVFLSLLSCMPLPKSHSPGCHSNHLSLPFSLSLLLLPFYFFLTMHLNRRICLSQTQTGKGKKYISGGSFQSAVALLFFSFYRSC